MLDVRDHRRDSAGLMYVYPVVSRRAGSVSVGINLNVNNACNWACVYCQVPDLKRGRSATGRSAPSRKRVERAARGDRRRRLFAQACVAGSEASGRRGFFGERWPTSAAEFPEAVACVAGVLRSFGLLGSVKLRVISNGSFLHRPRVRRRLAAIGELDGEVWFKLDRATASGIEGVNGIRLAPDKVRASLLQCADLAPTWVQTCYFAMDASWPTPSSGRPI